MTKTRINAREIRNAKAAARAWAKANGLKLHRVSVLDDTEAYVEIAVTMDDGSTLTVIRSGARTRRGLEAWITERHLTTADGFARRA